MGLMDFLQSSLYGDEKPPAYQPYQAATPTYNQQLSPQGQQTQNQLGQVLQGRLSAYQNGGSTLDPAYRAAVLSQAQQGATQAQKVANQGIAEQFNANGLLNSSAAGYAYGKTGAQAQLTMQNANDYLTQQDLQGVNQLQQTGQSYLNSQQQQSQQQAQGNLQAGEFGYNAGRQNSDNQNNYNMSAYNQQQQQRQGLLNGLFGLGKAAVTGGAGGFTPTSSGSPGGSNSSYNPFNYGAGGYPY